MSRGTNLVDSLLASRFPAQVNTDRQWNTDKGWVDSKGAQTTPYKKMSLWGKLFNPNEAQMVAQYNNEAAQLPFLIKQKIVEQAAADDRQRAAFANSISKMPGDSRQYINRFGSPMREPNIPMSPAVAPLNSLVGNVMGNVPAPQTGYLEPSFMPTIAAGRNSNLVGQEVAAQVEAMMNPALNNVNTENEQIAGANVRNNLPVLQSDLATARTKHGIDMQPLLAANDEGSARQLANILAQESKNRVGLNANQDAEVVLRGKEIAAREQALAKQADEIKALKDFYDKNPNLRTAESDNKILSIVTLTTTNSTDIFAYVFKSLIHSNNALRLFNNVACPHPFSKTSLTR